MDLDNFDREQIAAESILYLSHLNEDHWWNPVLRNLIHSMFSHPGIGVQPSAENLKSYIQQELFRRGILWTAYHAISWSHKRKDIEYTIKAFDEVFEKAKKIINNNKSVKYLIEGESVKPVFRKVSDFNSYIIKNK